MFPLSATAEHSDGLGAAARQIPRPAGENAGLRDDAVKGDALGSAACIFGNASSRKLGVLLREMHWGSAPFHLSKCVIPNLGALQPREGSRVDHTRTFLDVSATTRRYKECLKQASAAKRRHLKARHGSAGEQSATSPSPARDGTDRSFPNSQQSSHVDQLPEMV